MEQINTTTDTASSGEVEIQSTGAYSVDWGKPPIHHTGLGVVDALEEMPIAQLPTSGVVAAVETPSEKIYLDLSTTRLPDFIDVELDANRPPLFIDIPPTWTSGDSVQKPEQLPELVSASRVQMYKAPQAEQASDAILLGSEEAKQRMERMELHIDPDAPIPDSVIEALEAMPGQEITIKRQRSPVLDMAAIMVATGAGQLPFPDIAQPKLKPGQRYWTERELAEFDKQNQASAEALRLAEEKR